MAPKASIFGLDLNEKLLQKASAHPSTPKNVNFRRADIRELIDDDFDAIHVGFNITESHTNELLIKLKPGGLLWAPVETMEKGEKGVVVKVFDWKGDFREVVDMEFSPCRVPVSDLEEKLAKVDREIKEIYDKLQEKYGKTVKLKDFPANIHPLIKERKVLQAKIKRYST